MLAVLAIIAGSGLWERDGTPVILANLGGAGDPQLGTGTHGTSINNRGQVVGVPVLADNTTHRGFLWSRAARRCVRWSPFPTIPTALRSASTTSATPSVLAALPFEDSHAVIWPKEGAASTSTSFSPHPRRST